MEEPVIEVVGSVRIVRARDRGPFVDEVVRLLDEGRLFFLFDLAGLVGTSATPGYLLQWNHRLRHDGGRSAAIGGAILYELCGVKEVDDHLPRHFDREEDALAWLHDLEDTP